MANRVLLGKHGTYGYGIFVSNPGTDVLGANRTDLTYDSSVGFGQLLFTKLIGSTGTSTVTQDFNNHGFHCYAHLYWLAYEPSSTTGMSIASTYHYASSIPTSPVATTFTIEYINSTTGRMTYTRTVNSPYGFIACVYAEEGATG